MCMTTESKIKEAVPGNRSVWVLTIWWVVLWYPLGTIKTPTSNLITDPIWNPWSFRLVAVYLTACPQNNWCCLTFLPLLYFSIAAKMIWNKYLRWITNSSEKDSHLLLLFYLIHIISFEVLHSEIILFGFCHLMVSVQKFLQC